MKAIQVVHPGGPKVLELADVPDPKPGEGTVPPIDPLLESRRTTGKLLLIP